MPAVVRALSHPPAAVAVDGGPVRRVLGSAGPWLVHPPLRGNRGEPSLARIQVVLAGERDDLALLLSVTVGAEPRWTVEGVYD